MWNTLWKDFGDTHGDDQFQVKKGRSFPRRVCQGQKWGWVSQFPWRGCTILLGAGSPYFHSQPEGFYSPRCSSRSCQVHCSVSSGGRGRHCWSAEHGPWLYAILSHPVWSLFRSSKPLLHKISLDPQNVKRKIIISEVGVAGIFSKQTKQLLGLPHFPSIQGGKGSN